MKLNKTLMLTAICLLLAGCSKGRLEIDGEKIPVLETRRGIAADFSKGDIKIELPSPQMNRAWTQKNGNATNNMGHLASNPELKEVWRADFGRGNSRRDFLIATPVIADNTVFTIDANAVVSAFNQKDGKRLWERALKPNVREDKSTSLKGAGVAYYNGNVYATTGFGGVFAIDGKTGNVKWSTFFRSPFRIAPTVGNGRIFVQTLDNTVLALNAANGAEIWRLASNEEDTTVIGGANPAYSAELDVLIVGLSNGELRAIKASTGSPLWSDFLINTRRHELMSDINTVHSSPVISGGIVYAVGNNNIMTAIDIRTGQRLWEREIGSANLPWVVGKYIFLLANDATLIALQADSGKIIWETRVPAGDDVADKVGTIFSGPLLANNRLLVNTSNGYTFSISPYTGEILGFMTLRTGSALPPVIANGQVIITTTNANIIAYQ